VSADDPRHRPPGPPGPPGDVPDGFGPAEPGLDVLLELLTSGPTRDELGGEREALAMFRSSGPSPAPAASAASAASRAPQAPRASRAAQAPRAPRTPRWYARPVVRLGTAVALAAAAGFTVAAYTKNLPTPLQQAAYQALGFAGVPNPHHKPTGTHLGLPPGAPGSQASSGSSRPTAPVSPAPGPASALPPGTTQVSLSVTQRRIVAGGSDTFAGLLTGTNQSVSDVSLNLLERIAGQPTWHSAGNATTGDNGAATVTVKDLTANAAFRLAGPGGTLSRTVLVIVVPPVSASLVAGPHGQAAMLTASSPLASAGNMVVLQVQSGLSWTDVQERALDDARKVSFLTRAEPGRDYRMVLLPTAAHALSISNTLTLP
jgi:hypothetical protein